MRKLGTLTIIIFLFPLITPAWNSGQTQGSLTQPARANTPSPDEIIERYINASGGKGTLERITSRISKGTFEITSLGVSGPIEKVEKAPDNTLLTFVVPGMGPISQGLTSSDGWVQNPFGGVRHFRGEELAWNKRIYAFQRPVRLKFMYQQLYLTGIEKVRQRDTYVIEATPAMGLPDKLFFEVQTGLLVRIDTVAEGPKGKTPFQILLTDYREVDGIQYPFSESHVGPTHSLTIKYTEILHNTPLDDTRFLGPGSYR